MSQNGSFPQVGMKIPKILELPPPSQQFMFRNGLLQVYIGGSLTSNDGTLLVINGSITPINIATYNPSYLFISGNLYVYI